jgi:hypothetical protein
VLDIECMLNFSLQAVFEIFFTLINILWVNNLLVYLYIF